MLKSGSRENLLDMILKGSFWLALSRIFRIAINLISVAVLARVLTPAEFGVFVIAALLLHLNEAIIGAFASIPIIRNTELELKTLSLGKILHEE